MEGGLIVGLLVLLIICWIGYKYCYSPYQLFKHYGIPGPTPIPFFGNIFYIQKHTWMMFPESLIKTYGSVCGVYIGARPLLLIADLDMIKCALVDQSDLLTDREAVPDFFTRAVGLPPGLFVSRGDEWKQSRLAMAPAFSSNNLRRVCSHIINTCTNLSDAIAVHADSPTSVRVDKIFGEFAMECTLAIVFGELDASCHSNKEILIQSSTVLWTTVDEGTVPILWLILSHFPWMSTVLSYLMRLDPRGKHFISMHKACMKMVLQQAKNKNKAIVQLMTDAQIIENGISRKMNIDEIVTQVITFLMAGFETTSVTMAFTAYLLAMNQHIQEKLYKQIIDYYNEHPDASLLSAAQEIEYVDMVISESLRLYPPVTVSPRHTWKGVELKGVVVPPGTTILCPIYHIHHNPKYWPEPEQFIPERFSAKEKANRLSNTYIPFGLGPRNCIGSRFALLEIKMMLIATLRRSQFLQCPDTQVPLKTSYRMSVAPKDGVFLRIASR